jgi:serine/threonine protein kinase/tetratricopeptide (TPR) repeat protein
MDERSIFMAALAMETAPERSVYLDEACGGDQALRQRLEALLASHEQAGSFLGKPVPERLAEQLATPRPPEETGAETPATEYTPRPIVEGQGSHIGPYKLLQEIGEGGMGSVWMAQQQEPVKRLVALKIIKPGMDSRQVIARFEAERQALALMDHPNIARVFDAGTVGSRQSAGTVGSRQSAVGSQEGLPTSLPTADCQLPTGVGRPYFVMELVKGVPITKYCDEHRLTPKQRLELFLPVCQAIQHAHQKGIIHRDIKPSNVLVASYDGKPVPKVIDFGIAKAAGQPLTEKTLVTGFGMIVGTLEYMSPEQAMLNALDIDTRSDVYSLGVLLYELLTGTTPFETKRLQKAAFDEILRIIRKEEPPRPSTRLSTTDEAPSVAANRGMEPKKLSALVKGELDWIVMKALEKDRNRRYESANSFALDIHRYLADEPVQACPPSPSYRLRKFVRRNQAGLATTAVVLLVLLAAGVGVGWVLWDRATQQAARLSTTERTVSIALARAGQLAMQAQQMRNGTSEEASRVIMVWRRAEDALAQAEAALTTGIDDDVLRQQVAAMQVQLEKGKRQTGHVRARALRKEKLLRDLDEARLARSVWVDGDYKFRGSAEKYAAAFAAYDLEVTPERIDELARRIAAEEPEVRDALIMALGDWAMAAGRRRTNWTAENLLALARAADGNAWRKRLLAAALAHDRPTLLALSAEARRSSLPASSVVQLVGILFKEGEHEECLAVLRWGRGRHPSEFWLQFGLGNALYLEKRETRTALELEEAIGCYRAALALRPEAGEVHDHLAGALYERGKLDEAVAEAREAARLNKDDARTQYNLGEVLHARGQVDEAIAAYRTAIRIDKNLAAAHLNLGNALREKGQLDEAIKECREAIRLKGDSPLAHNNLGLALQGKGQLDEAIKEHRRALLLKEDFPEALNNLGNALQAQGRFDEALVVFRRAIHLKKDYAFAHHGHGLALRSKGRLDDAVAAIREAIRLEKDFFEAHFNLGVTLGDMGRVDEAIAAFNEAVRIRPNDAGAHGNLSFVLQQKGQFREALKAMRRSHELGSRDPRWPSDDSAQKVRQCERLVELDGRLPDILQGKTSPANSVERIELAGLCTLKRLHRAAARFYQEALAAEPELTDDLKAGHRYNAACVAALAATGQGKDADKLDAGEYARLRRQALSWLQDDLKAWGRLLDRESEKAGPHIVGRMQHWLTDTDFAAVRGSEALARLPEGERQPWRQLWSDVADTLARARAKTMREKK